MHAPPCFRETADGVLVTIKLQTRAKSNAIGDLFGSELRVKVIAPPVDSAANDALIRLLADTLGMTRNQVELVRGPTSRHKTVLLRGARLSEIRSRLLPRA